MPDSDSHIPAPIDITSAVVSFCQEFRPCQPGESPGEIFTVGRLRTYLSAWPTPMESGGGADDPLSVAIDMLAQNGFNLTATSFSGACLLVHRKL